MRVLMLETRRGSEDGFAVRRFHKGCCYDIADSLARAFLRAGWAKHTDLPPTDSELLKIIERL